MFDNLKESIDDLASTDGDSSKLMDRANSLFSIAGMLEEAVKKFNVPMPEYPMDDMAQEAWSEMYEDIEVMRGELESLQRRALIGSKYMETCSREAEAEEADERTYGDYATQVYSTR